MKYRKVLPRRTFLRGSAGVIVGLPFLDEMRTRSVFASEAEPPTRAFNVFFGLGYQREIQRDRMTTRGGLLPLEPLIDRFKDKLAFLTEVNQTNANGRGNAHYVGAGAAFTGTPTDRINRSFSVTGGASMDQVLRNHVHPGAMPEGVFKALNTGTWWRFSDSTQRYIHCRNANGQPAGDPRPPQTPKELFAKIFGNFPGMVSPNPRPDNGAALRKATLRQSILDAVTEQYKHYTSDAGNLGKASRILVKDHFDHVRAMEKEVSDFLSMKDPIEPKEDLCTIPNEPGNAAYAYRNGNDGDGIDVTVDRLSAEVRLMAKLFAQGVACDRVRFGSFVFQSGGERIRLKGKYDYNGRTITTFDDPKNLSGNSNAKGTDNCSHEFWHRNDMTWCRRHLHFMMEQIAYLFEQFDDIKDANDRSVLDNAMLTVTTESGSGQHKDPRHELDDVLHIIGSGNGRFKVGGNDTLDMNADGLEVYNTMLAAYGIPKNKRLGDGRGDLSDKLRA